jgi:hypothetical protein
MRTEYATPELDPIVADGESNMIWGVDGNTMTIMQGQVLSGSVVGLYLNVGTPIVAGAITLNVDQYPISAGPPAPTGATLTLQAPNYVGFATFARGTYPYSPMDGLALRWTTTVDYDPPGPAPAIATLLIQAD